MNRDFEKEIVFQFSRSVPERLLGDYLPLRDQLGLLGAHLQGNRHEQARLPGLGRQGGTQKNPARGKQYVPSRVRDPKPGEGKGPADR